MGDVPNFRAEWTDRTDPAMAEAAEALGIPTDMVMAYVWLSDDRMLAMFTPPEDEDEVWGGLLERDGDGILGVVAKERRPGLMAEFKRNLGIDG